MANHSSQRRNFFISIIVMLVVLAGLVFLVWQTADAATTLRDIRKDVADIQARARRADALEARWITVEPKAATIEKAFLSRDDLPEFFGMIEATAAAAGVTEVTTIEDTAVSEIDFRLSVSGPFSGVFIFVTHLNVLPTLLFVEDVSFSTAARSGSQVAAALPSDVSADVVIRVPLRSDTQVSSESI